MELSDNTTPPYDTGNTFNFIIPLLLHASIDGKFTPGTSIFLIPFRGYKTVNTNVRPLSFILIRLNTQ